MHATYWKATIVSTVSSKLNKYAEVSVNSLNVDYTSVDTTG